MSGTREYPTPGRFVADIGRFPSQPEFVAIGDTVTGEHLSIVYFRPDAAGMTGGERAHLANRIVDRWNRTGVETLPQWWDHAEGCFVFDDGSKA